MLSPPDNVGGGIMILGYPVVLFVQSDIVIKTIHERLEHF